MVGPKRASYDVWSGIGSKFHSSDAADGLRTRAETFTRFHKRGNVLISTGICLAFSLDLSHCQNQPGVQGTDVAP